MIGKFFTGFFACLFLFQGPLLWAQDPLAPTAWEWEDWQETPPWIYDPPPPEDQPPMVVWEWEIEEETIPPQRAGFLSTNRTFEFGWQMGLNAATNFIYMGNPIVVSLDDFLGGARINFGMDVVPLFMNLNIRDEWGFGLDIGVTYSGNLRLGNMQDLEQARGELFGLGMAFFAELGIPVFFQVRDFRVRVRPAAFSPLAYVRTGLNYSFGPSSAGGNRGQRLEVDYDMRIFTPFSTEGMFGDGNVDSPGPRDIVGGVAGNMGVDFSFGVEYPLLPMLSVGVNIVNLPFLASRMDHYMRIRGNFFVDTSYADFGNMFGENGELPDEASGFNVEDTSFGTVSGGQRVRRPFTMLFYADYRPLGTPTIAIIPSLGFSINQLYARAFALEGGVNARFDLANIFITTIGMNYNDRRFRHSLDLALDLRIFKFGIGFSVQSPSFVRSFQGTGFGANVGVTMGF